MTRPSLFPAPALSRPAPIARGRAPGVSATATGSFRLGGGTRVATVDVLVDGVVFSCLVRGRRVVPPMQRGAVAVRFTDPALEVAVHRAAVQAARDAERRGWLDA